MPVDASSASSGTLIVIGGSCLGISALIFALKRRAFACWSRAEGKVISVTPAKNSDGNNSGTWAARIEFQTRDGKRIEFTDPVKSNPPVAKVGDSVPILYKPEDPENAVVDKFFHRHLFETVLLIFGLVATIIYLSRPR